VRNNATNAFYWQADAMNTALQLTGQTHGNGVATTQVFDSQTGRLTDIQAGAGASVANFKYEWDTLGNLHWRKDLTQNVEEIFDAARRRHATLGALATWRRLTRTGDSHEEAFLKSTQPLRIDRRHCRSHRRGVRRSPDQRTAHERAAVGHDTAPRLIEVADAVGASDRKP
jgi:hypothetical protein